jgi:hypothetical protein
LILKYSSFDCLTRTIQLADVPSGKVAVKTVEPAFFPNKSQYIKIEYSAGVFVIFYEDDMKTPFDVTCWKSVDDFLNGRSSFWKNCEYLYNTLNDKNIRYKWMPFVKTASNCSSLAELEMKMNLMGY